MISSSVKSFGNVSEAFVRGVQEQAKKINFDIKGAAVDFKLHKASDLQNDVVELRHLPKDADVIAAELTLPGYQSIVGKSFSSDINGLNDQVLVAYNNFLHSKNNGVKTGWFG